MPKAISSNSGIFSTTTTEMIESIYRNLPDKNGGNLTRLLPENLSNGDYVRTMCKVGIPEVLW